MGNELANWSVVCDPEGANFSLFRDTYPQASPTSNPQASPTSKFDIDTISIV